MRALKRIVVLAGIVVLAMPAAAFAKDVTESFRSSVTQVVPSVSGLEIKVVGRDAALELRNDTSRTVIVQGYDREPYLRFTSDGTVEENKYSPATYLNRDRAGSQKVPGDANPLARPKWERVSSTPVYRWFDHRIHITNPQGTPPQAKGKEGATKISDWNVPLRVESERVLVRGSLFWDPESSSDGFPVGVVIAAVAALLVLGLLGFLWLRRRSGPSPPREDKPVKEAW